MSADIILDIVELLAPVDVLSFSLCSSYLRNLRNLLLPSLYTTLIFKSSKKCKSTLEMLTHCPEISKHIKRLAVRLNYYLSWPKPDEWLDEEWVIGAIKRMGWRFPGMGFGGLYASGEFFAGGYSGDRGARCMGCVGWNVGSGVAGVGCPKLKSVFTNIGMKPLDPHSELFNFTDLTSFSLVVRHGLGGNEPLPPGLWNMLTTSPNLEELAICSFSSSTRILDFSPLSLLTFPKLHTLTLGSFGYQSDFTLGPAELGSFLEKHSGLDAALLRLTMFIGVYQQLAELPHPESVESVDLTCKPVYESRVEVLCAALARLKSLRSLDIWTHVPEGGAAAGEGVRGLLEGIGRACPSLEEWHFMCTTAFTSKPMSHLLSTLPHLKNLTHFSLTKGHKYIDEPMLSTAIQLTKANPTLKQINIRWVRERCPNHLKQEGSYEVLPCGSVVLVERGIMFVGRSFERRGRVEGKLPRSSSLASSSSSGVGASGRKDKGRGKGKEKADASITEEGDGDEGEVQQERKRESVVQRIRSRGLRLLLKSAASFSSGLRTLVRAAGATGTTHCLQFSGSSLASSLHAAPFLSFLYDFRSARREVFTSLIFILHNDYNATYMPPTFSSYPSGFPRRMAKGYVEADAEPIEAPAYDEKNDGRIAKESVQESP
ncbi:hypothetical protein BDQ17DRAFT_1339883 [Cyathus striatus]|nr:hypothetical protein BDQ17DRAFT_1339883 [Cyathus striatus]